MLGELALGSFPLPSLVHFTSPLSKSQLFCLLLAKCQANHLFVFCFPSQFKTTELLLFSEPSLVLPEHWGTAKAAHFYSAPVSHPGTALLEAQVIAFSKELSCALNNPVQESTLSLVAISSLDMWGTAGHAECLILLVPVLELWQRCRSRVAQWVVHNGAWSLHFKSFKWNLFYQRIILKAPESYLTHPLFCVRQCVSYVIPMHMNLSCVVLTSGYVCSPCVPILAFHSHKREEKSPAEFLENILNGLLRRYK